MNVTNLSSLISKHFNLNLSRVKALTLFVFSILRARTVNLSMLSITMDYEKSDSAYQRLKRFIKEVSLDSFGLAKLIATIIGFDNKTRWKLIFDRTNWKFGKKHINILFLAICREHLSIPIFFTFLKDKKSGNSNQEDRIELMKKFIKTFGKKCIELILGDREFIGVKWLKYLQENSIAFCVRIKEDWQKVSLPNGRMVEVKKCFPGLKAGEIRSLGLRQLGEGKKAVMCYITGLRTEKGDWVIVAHSEGLENPCEVYRERWQIECMFKALKTSGFNVEDTHVTEPKRLECLLGVLCIAYTIGYKVGEIQIKENPPKLKKHGYWPKSIVRYGLDKLGQLMHRISTKLTEFKRLMRKIFPPVRTLERSRKFFVP